MFVLVLLFIIEVFVFVFFFFQAEDGIRDWSVTGVQTCALPIWSPRPARVGRPGGPRRPPGALGREPARCRPAAGVGARALGGRSAAGQARPRGARSEERRVGKSVDLSVRGGLDKENIKTSTDRE